MTTGLVKDQNLEKQMQKQMGCMAGFLQIFDRHQILTGKRLYTAKRLPPSPVVDATSESEKSAPASPAISGDLRKPIHPQNAAAKQIPEAELRSPTEKIVFESPPKSPLPFPIVELKEGNRSPWKFCKEAPRLSLDSRAITDAKGGFHPKANRGDSFASDASDGGQHNRSPSVVARLMGLEPLPNASGSEPEKKPELRRSASESRVSKEIFHSRFTTDGSNFYSNQTTRPPSAHFNNAMKNNTPMATRCADPRNHSLKNANKAEQIKGLNRDRLNSTSPWRAPPHRKSFFDSGDIFPEPRQTVSIYGEREKRLQMRGIDEPSKDLETSKQILEALQLKGLLHPKQPFQQNQVRHRNFIYDESPIVLLKASGSSVSTSTNRRMGNGSSPSTGRNQVRGVRRNYTLSGESSPSVSPRRERSVRSPTRASRSSSPTTRRSEGNGSPGQPTTLTKPKPLSVKTRRRLTESAENRKPSPVRSPKLRARTTGPDPTVDNRSPGDKKAMAERPHTPLKEKITTIVVAEDDSSSTSEISYADTERSKAEKHKEEGKSLLGRCDKLLHSRAEMAASDMQPSPVSVLDPPFYKDELLTPSPITTKRSINLRDQSDELEEDTWSPVISPIRSKRLETSEDSGYLYISDILRAYHYLPEDSDIYLLLEKQQYLKGNDMSKVSRIQRKLIFDTITEIIDRNKRLPPWKKDSFATPSLDKVWLEFQTIQEHEKAEEDWFEIVCGVLKKDLAKDAVTGWGDCPVEMSEVVLDMERLIFKDLICETIWDLAVLASGGTLSSMMPRRKLVF